MTLASQPCRQSPRSHPEKLARIEWLNTTPEGSQQRVVFLEAVLCGTERVDVVGRQLKAVTVRDGIGRARFHANNRRKCSAIIVLYTLA